MQVRTFGTTPLAVRGDAAHAAHWLIAEVIGDESDR